MPPNAAYTPGEMAARFCRFSDIHYRYLFFNLAWVTFYVFVGTLRVMGADFVVGGTFIFLAIVFGCFAYSSYRSAIKNNRDVACACVVGIVHTQILAIRFKRGQEMLTAMEREAIESMTQEVNENIMDNLRQAATEE